MNWDTLHADLAGHGLFVMGTSAERSGARVLVGAAGGMWPVFAHSPEHNDNAPDPLDRWSKRVLGAICAPHGWTLSFPSDGPPYAPFIAWAKDTGRFWNSPTGMLVHDVAGLMISIRGAIHMADVPPPRPVSKPSPCGTCADKPCATACPVAALSGSTPYDVPACKTYLNGPQGGDCMQGGCLSRRACPLSQRFKRAPDQSAFHMRSFNPR